MESFVPKVILLRHGERGDYVTPKIDSEIEFDPLLTENGRNQVKASSKFIKNLIHEDLAKLEIYSSPLIRCIQTSALFLNEIGMKDKPINITNSLVENLITLHFPFDPLNKCLLRTKDKGEILEKYTLGFNFIDEKNEKFGFPETKEQVKARF